MKTSQPAFSTFSTVLALTLGTICTVQAGTQKEVKQVEPVQPVDSWEFKMAVPSWLAATSGTVGVDGHNVGVYISAESILRHLDMIAAVSAEARHGRFGIYGDFMYISASDGAETKGLVSKVDIMFDETLADLEVNYRLIEGPRGWLDVRAGVRYTNIYSKTTLSPNDSAIDAASARLVDTVSSALRDTLKKDLRRMLDGQDPTLPIPPLSAGQKEKLLELIAAAKEDPELAAALKAQLTASTAALKAAAQPRIDAAKNRVQNNIASGLKKALNRSIALNEWWLDPYVGLAGRYNLSKAFYLIGKGDIGGFGIGSELTWQLYGALGCQLSRSWYAEAGYRYLYTDYQQNNFVYNVTQSGVQMTVGINF